MGCYACLYLIDKMYHKNFRIFGNLRYIWYKVWYKYIDYVGMTEQSAAPSMVQVGTPFISTEVLRRGRGNIKQARHLGEDTGGEIGVLELLGAPDICTRLCDLVLVRRAFIYVTRG